ncbi:biotin--[acetyl-CoA-carboxylase] ligase [Luteibacter sp. UNCMF366Tsu5.1]|uniref:biotin--[acetyl-CoA-carboxylase] ligase n=1 Tax=Luteibacter sp. UNCMF366Tsu5.1 TaxID=1502758 RepID=UPI0009089246|nr:biotin--[acetyl-CoA-carboxylase] ligase [Luteibacter sp. UNCMF366Tsu5.1]SFW41545.1 BirA family transcriptional regulator, biotin operon repressor / biotin-[acetyl-CoA-carboxylase] ligase [Luteibacter sp. UNCMF366Tsu5.1]
MLARDLLEALAGGEAVSGAALARKAGVTRAAVWKQIEALRLKGVPIEAKVGGGYRLPWTTELLESMRIRAALDPGIAAHVGMLEVHWDIDSTSSELARRIPVLDDLSFVIAEAQSAGRGRRGRTWLSPPGMNLYLSALKRFDGGFAALSGLSLAVGVMLVRALGELGIRTAGLKWPNDLLAGNAKLGGILVELSGEYSGPCAAVIGVGLNIRLPDTLHERAGQPITDLAALLGGDPPGRNRIAAAVVTELTEGLRTFERHGFAAFADEYAASDLLRGEPLRILDPRGEYEAVGEGVDDRGALCVRSPDGVRVTVDSAEVSVRRNAP